MKTNYTPAPWVARNYGYAIDVVTDNDKSFGVVHIGTHSELRLADYPKEEAIANAKLIAAAPELLEALQDCLKLISRNFSDNQRFQMQDKIKTVIEKATL